MERKCDFSLYYNVQKVLTKQRQNKNIPKEQIAISLNM